MFDVHTLVVPAGQPKRSLRLHLVVAQTVKVEAATPHKAFIKMVEKYDPFQQFDFYSLEPRSGRAYQMFFEPAFEKAVPIHDC